MRKLIRGVQAMIVGAGLLAVAGPASAVTTIYSCGSYATSVKLGADLSYSGTGDCIVISNSADVDFNDRTIECTGSQCGVAVKAFAGGDGVVVTGPGTVLGPWDIGVQDAKKVQNIVMGPVEQAISDSGNLVLVEDCKFNCVGPSTTPCVDAQFTRSTDRFRDNLFWGSNGTYLRLLGKSGSGRGPIVENNTLQLLFGVGIEQLGSSRKFRAFSNVINDCLACEPQSQIVPFSSEGYENGAFSLSDTSQWGDNVCSDETYCFGPEPPTPTCPSGTSPMCSDGVPICL